MNVLWPAPIRGAYDQGDASGGDWVGSLIPGMQDTSGLLYKRNRYYNPQAGQFTQPDPIGIAGGLNTYGFAAGDPGSYGDPYGLRIEFIGEEARQLRANYRALRKVTEDGLRSGDWRVRDSSRRLLNTMNDLDAPPRFP